MRENPDRRRGRLRRLAVPAYTGTAFGHWSLTIEDRHRGWLTHLHHACFRELLCHMLAREALLCPAYCLMPDHGHLLLAGAAADSDQRRALQHLRRSWNRLREPSGHRLQRQAYDHVLREEERQRGSFATVAAYIFANPVRAGLVTSWPCYPFAGCLTPGFPELDPRADSYWDSFWRVYASERERREPAGLMRPSAVGRVPAEAEDVRPESAP